MKKFLISAVLLSFASFVYAQEKPEEYFKKGLQFANESKYDEAITNLKKAVELKPKYAESHLHLGVVLANKKQYDEAIKEIEAAVSQKPESITAHWLLAMLYEKKFLKDKAILEWQKVLDLHPKEEMKALAEKHLNRLKGK
ncbi:MAG: hypothetical protein A2452_05520 [Candidatus Firestonebacteria bacterium RIFOXYC2_FULL_39_67]|nr:MAG: hypothetical protein A2536_10350 [Candidatus Firestonebacteria bacterium RIFOXYD2_FULL_39_29]OGF53221.1 MAG: hypothetical protein A2497_06280 [Candidatus Firestonebacteria bacterium RifOxyC12_full_39_7]OGF56398.1 MAG: hypothetical protein A2452_05520 [Candidatus Firestonebacteria bacterium RIFOXYC2_FULL_39_67]